MGFAAVERRDVVSATKRVPNLVWAGESCAAKNENAKRFHGFFSEQRGRSGSEGNPAGGGNGEFDEMTARAFHYVSLTFLVIPSEVEESLVENEETRSFETARRN